MSEEIAKTPNLATGMLVGTAAVGFPLINGAFNAVDKIADIVRRSNLKSSAADVSHKAAQFAQIVRSTIDETRAQIDPDLAETLKGGIEQLEQRASWLTAENFLQALEDNSHVDVERVRYEIAIWIAEPLRNAIASVSTRGRSSKLNGHLREIRLVLVKQAYVLLDADISAQGESSFGLQQLGKGILRKTLIVLGSIPLAALVIWGLIRVQQIFN
jgi:hypothetical protein